MPMRLGFWLFRQTIFRQARLRNYRAEPSALQNQERKRSWLRSRTAPPDQEIQELTSLDRMLAEAQRALEEWQGRQEEIGG